MAFREKYGPPRAENSTPSMRQRDLVTSRRSNELEKLKGNLADRYSIRINKQWRIVFRFQNDQAIDVQVIDYHT